MTWNSERLHMARIITISTSWCTKHGV